MTIKPLGHRAYGHIAHLPGSRKTPGDKTLHPGQARICCERTRDRHDVITVQEKLDGSCVAIVRVGDALHALTRAGYDATTSPFEQHHLFAAWALRPDVTERALAVLDDGERLCGEWLAQAHGTRYQLTHEPFVAFDLMCGHDRFTVAQLTARLGGRFVQPRLIHQGGPLSIEAVLAVLEPSGHGAIDPVEGAVWRVERRGVVDFLGKFVRPTKIDGCYLPEMTGKDAVWNWRPE